MNVQNTNTGPGGQNNYNAPGQNVNYGADQINIGRDLVRNFTTTPSESHKSLWAAIAGVGASHKAEQQFSRGKCLEGTREEALRMIHKWRKAKNQSLPICWLSGAAGVGKSAIAMTIAKSCEEDGLVSSFFLFKSDPRRNNPSALMLTIAHDLTVTIPALRAPINQRISDDPRILEATIEDQFMELVLKPSLRSRPWRRRIQGLVANVLLRKREPTLVIIDGLDECSDSAIQLRILSAIADSYQRPPRPPLRFLICSRSESWLRQAFKAPPLRDITRSIVLDERFSPNKDIERYLVHEFGEIRKSPEYAHITFPDPWPSQKDFDCLKERSDGQFVYIATALKFVKDPYRHPVKQLCEIIDNAPVKQLARSPYPELDNLYHVVLDANPDHDTVMLILAAIMLPPHMFQGGGSTRSPECLELLLGLSSGEVILALRAMHSVLDIPGPKDRISIYHTSFAEYLFDPNRSGEFYIREIRRRYTLARRWLQALSRDRVGEYSVGQLYDDPTSALFTHWMSYCASLPVPTPDLLDKLGNLDISALFLPMLLHNWRNNDPKTLTWDETFKPIVKWLSSSVVAGVLPVIKRFTEQPKFFHIESDGATITRMTLDAVSIITGCRLAKVAKFTHFPLLRVTGCYCHDIDVNSTTSSYHSGHRTYQSACLQVLKEYLTTLRPPSGLVATCDDLLNSLLLLHCPFGPELFSLCGRFFKLLRTHSQPDEAPRNSQKYRTKLLEWLETCPECYAREAEALRAQVISVFCEADPADTAAHSNTGEPAQILIDIS